MTNSARPTIPTHWAETSLLDLSIKIRGISYKKGDESNVKKNGFIKLLRANNIEDNEVNFYELIFVPHHMVNEIQLLINFDIIIAMSSGSINVVGKTAQLRQVDEKISVGAFCGILRPIEEIEKIFLGYFLKTKEYRNQISDLARGTNINNIKIEYLEKIKVLLPPLNEQKRIVEKLDAILPKVKSAKARLEKIPVILKKFRQSILAAACSGRLTEDWREGKNLPEWEEKSLGDLAELITSGSRDWAKYYSEKGAIFIRAQNINQDFLDLSDVAFVSLPKGTEGIRTAIKRSDILITITGANVTKSAIVNGEIGEAYVNQHIALLRLKNCEYAHYIFSFIISKSDGRKQLEDKAYGVGKPGLNLRNIKDVLVHLPPLEEQGEIVRRVQKFFAVADSLEAQYKKAWSRVEKLEQSILAKAFRGELAAPDPTDEPATELLKRILAEKAKLETGKKTRKAKEKQ